MSKIKILLINFLFHMFSGADFAYSWNGKPGRKYQSKKDQIKQNLATVARNLYCKYFKDVDLTPHGSMATLHKISEVLSRHAQHSEVSLSSRSIF